MTQSVGDRGSHTPGPWEVEQSAHNGATVRTSGPEPVWYIADIARCLPSGPEETLANARLIAAAPALLEALEPFALLAASEDSAGVNMNDPISKWLTIAQLQAARAAIQSATGEG